MDSRMLDILVCPVCKGPLKHRKAQAGKQAELICSADRLAYPVRDGIPIMWTEQAREMDVTEEVG